MVLRRHRLDVVEALAGHVAGRLLLIDVRERVEWLRGYAPGSLHVPFGELHRRLCELPSEQPIAFVCQTGRRSSIAATAARRAGLDARTVTGGMDAWERRGFALERPPG